MAKVKLIRQPLLGKAVVFSQDDPLVKQVLEVALCLPELVKDQRCVAVKKNKVKNRNSDFSPFSLPEGGLGHFLVVDGFITIIGTVAVGSIHKGCSIKHLVGF